VTTDGARAQTAGSIYDLGYQGYTGPRLGRRHAVRALYTYSLRGAFGIGRSGRAKLAPFGFAFLALLPALVSVGFSALVSQAGGPTQVASPISYATYLGFSLTLLVLFCAAQAPELVGRDQRYNVLPLYFSRALRRTDYAIAKLASLTVSVLLVLLAPQLLLFAGRVLAARDVPAAFLDNVPSVPPILASTTLAAGLLAAISIALAAFTPRRAYATAAIIAAFVVPPIVVSIITELAAGAYTQVAIFLDPTDLLTGANSWIFGRTPGNAVLRGAGLPGQLYVVAVVAEIAIAWGVTLRRYARIAA
jgi:ABC-2 type transport system permease protein